MLETITSTDDTESRARPSRGAVHLEKKTVVARPADLMVPIRSLGENHRGRIGEHLLALSPQDRYFRFGFTAKDAQIQAYVDGLNFERDEIFGIYNRRLKLIGMAHLAYSSADRVSASSEFGVSVSEHVRGRGYGARLFERAVMHARNEGVTAMYVHVLSENTAMLKIARRGGATVVRDGSESEAYLRLTPATFQTQVTEIMEEHLAQANYHLKAQAKQFWDTIGRFQHAWRPAKEDSPSE
ncbi:GNAT family N-acetyltransferase [Rhodoferax fermentans]|uniref:GNAT family N-acetyltransferase n=1 Tax=Rhodoferax fermentans TaxID=28066 RepID=A0A1T1AX64_RHOFE|nr:GNAT family N-acetyltransferase [Rhodoferax fermentans]MBK1683795.1 N-acetyltransferase [Rhodoferax fermentans]OOV08726.1 GNAT family N-acetyltransferase [Rhodoferax fermentans]